MNNLALEEAVSRVRAAITGTEEWYETSVLACPDIRARDLRQILDALAARQDAADEIERLTGALAIAEQKAAWPAMYVRYWRDQTALKEIASLESRHLSEAGVAMRAIRIAKSALANGGGDA